MACGENEPKHAIQALPSRLNFKAYMYSGKQRSGEAAMELMEHRMLHSKSRQCYIEDRFTPWVQAWFPGQIDSMEALRSNWLCLPDPSVQLTIGRRTRCSKTGPSTMQDAVWLGLDSTHLSYVQRPHKTDFVVSEIRKYFTVVI